MTMINMIPNDNNIIVKRISPLGNVVTYTFGAEQLSAEGREWIEKSLIDAIVGLVPQFLEAAKNMPPAEQQNKPRYLGPQGGQ